MVMTKYPYRYNGWCYNRIIQLNNLSGFRDKSGMDYRKATKRFYRTGAIKKEIKMECGVSYIKNGVWNVNIARAFDKESIRRYYEKKGATKIVLYDMKITEEDIRKGVPIVDIA